MELEAYVALGLPGNPTTIILPPGPFVPNTGADGPEPRNWGVVLHGKRDLRKEPRAYPLPPKAGQVTVAVSFCGICGSDVHCWHDAHWGNIDLTLPVVMGHEASGRVIAVGPDVANVKVGDRVALMPYTYYGLLVKYANHPAQLCLPLPDHVSDVEAAYNEPLAVGYNACARAGITPANAGSLNVVVIGCGPVGLATIACLLALGVSPDNICATDLSKARLETAQNYTPPDGVIPATATRQTINALHTPPELASDFAALSKAVRDMFANKTVDIVIDAASFPSTLGAAVRIVKPRGVIAVVGMGSISPPTPMLEISHKEIDLRGCFAYGESGYARALDLQIARKVAVKQFISHKITDLGMANEAFIYCDEAGKSKDVGAVKVMFDVGGVR